MFSRKVPRFPLGLATSHAFILRRLLDRSSPYTCSACKTRLHGFQRLLPRIRTYRERKGAVLTPEDDRINVRRERYATSYSASSASWRSYSSITEIRCRPPRSFGKANQPGFLDWRRIGQPGTHSAIFIRPYQSQEYGFEDKSIQRSTTSREGTGRFSTSRHHLTASAKYSTATNSSRTLEDQANQDRDTSDPEKQATDSLSNRLRLCLRCHPASPVVLTVSQPQPSASPLQESSDKRSPTASFSTSHHGLTLSSLTPLSIRPEDPPLLTFNIRVPSRTHALLEEVKECDIHFLRATTEGASLADWYARVVPSSDESKDQSDTTTSLPWTSGDGLSAIATVLHCQLHPASLRVADHVIVVVSVSGITTYDLPGHETEESSEILGLHYVHGSYRKVGSTIEP